jgi:hypothetical protein
MFVWVWKYAGSDAPQWSTCFDVLVEGAAKGGSDAKPVTAKTDAAPVVAPAAPVADYAAPVVAAAAPVAPAAAPPATTPAPVVPQAVYEGAVETVWETIDVWTTVWDSKRRRHVKQIVQ